MANNGPIALLGYLPAKVVTTAFHYLPLKYGGAIGKGLGAALFNLLAKRRKITMENYGVAFPGSSELERSDVVKSAYENFGLMLAEAFYWAPRFSDRELVERTFKVEGFGNFERAWKRGKGVICPTAHFGNFEIANAILASRGFATNSVIRTVDNGYIDRLCDSYRGMFGVNVIKKENAIYEIIKKLRNREVVTIAIDQNASGNGVFVRFFGKWAATVTSPAIAALRTGAPVVPLYSYREKEGRLRVVVLPELSLEKTGNIKSDVWVNTSRLAKIQEEFIMKHPKEWFWIHRRWKTQPTAEEVEALELVSKADADGSANLKRLINK